MGMGSKIQRPNAFEHPHFNATGCAIASKDNRGGIS